MMRVPLCFLLSLGLAAMAGAQGESDQDTQTCMKCHGSRKLGKLIELGSERTFNVDPKTYARSVHSDLDCTDCHPGIGAFPHQENPPEVDCGSCHDEEQEKFAESVHAAKHERVQLRAARCWDCHGKHDILPSDDPKAHTYSGNIEKTCASCHSRPDVLQFVGLGGRDPVKAYDRSIHAKIMHEQPDKGAPSCVSCHGFHEIFTVNDPRSSFSPINIPATCGKCHEQAMKEYKESVHWDAVRHGHYESPACNDCHGEHAIASPTDPGALTNRLNLSSRLCATCHTNEPLMERFGLDARRISSYMKTYHGLAVFEGSTEAATCTSCHEVHAIRSYKDPESSVYPNNLRTTCATCHQDISEDFARIAVHPVNQQERNPTAYWIKQIYVYMILIVVAGMLLHNLIIMAYHIRRKYRMERDCGFFTRFQNYEVYLHLLLILSFTTLVLTGFALKFPRAFWAEWLAGAGMSAAVRGTAHRVAAVVLVAVSIAQFVHFVATTSGRRDLRCLIPTLGDLKDFWRNMRYHLGLSRKKAQFNRFDYTEKIEYLALIWGVIVMALTGMILWFPEFFVGKVPWWTFETAEVIHLYEAGLATLAILIWHVFFVVFHPDIYPLNLTVVHGKLCRKRFKAHHPLEFIELHGEQAYKEKDNFPDEDSY